MAYDSTHSVITDLEKKGEVFRISTQLSPNLEMPTLARLVYARGGPALFFEKVEGSPFKALSNLYGTRDRIHYLFRHSLPRLQKLFEIAADPSTIFRKPLSALSGATLLPHALPIPSFKHNLQYSTSISELPGVTSWPMDGGPFITLPQVYSENPSHPSLFTSNMGMYRIQLSGNDYLTNQEVGLHYQIHRGLGGHHAIALQTGNKLRISIWVGGPPSHTLAAIMPLPENVPEVVFAGLLGCRGFRYHRENGYVISDDADFCILGEIDLAQTKTEGPFGDHLGYYSLKHDMPVLKIHKVIHRKNAIWPFTVVGRPPQEDTEFGHFIHTITAPMIPRVLPGVKEVHAVDESGVHPLLLAIGSERYVPYIERRPRELHTLAHSILGFGQLSLAKILMLVAGEDNTALTVRDIPAFLQHVLERFRPEEDLHFVTRTTMDTLDYSGGALNKGSKLFWLAAGPVLRSLKKDLPPDLSIPPAFSSPQVVMPGIVAIQAPKFTAENGRQTMDEFCNTQYTAQTWEGFPLIVLCDDSNFMAKSLSNFLWATFTRTDPAPDISGLGAFFAGKHWGCTGPVVMDARIKPHHSPILEDDPKVISKLENLACFGGPLHGLLS